MIAGVIPQSGRTCYASLSRINEITEGSLSGIIRVLEESKEHSTTDFGKAQKYLKTLQKQGYDQFALAPDTKRENRPIRPVLLGLDTKIDGIDVRIEGTDTHNVSSKIREAEADFAIVGFDELLASMQTYLNMNGRLVTRWGNFNDEQREPTDVRVAGSANLKYFDDKTQRKYQDFVGFFVIGNKETRRDEGIENRLENGQKAYVKGRYEGIVQQAFPDIKTVPVKDVEDAVKDDKYGLGIEIVRTGKTARGKDLVVYGEPLFLSESLLVADYGRFQRNPDLKRVVQALQPQEFFDEKRISNFVDWYILLESNLGDNWIGKPDIETLLLGKYPEVLRPYTLKSREWKPSDDLPTAKKLAEALFIDDRLRYLRTAYDFEKRLVDTDRSRGAVAKALVQAIRAT